MIRGRKIIVTDAVIAEVFRLLVEGPVWANKILKLQVSIEVFNNEGQDLIFKGKRSSTAIPWRIMGKTSQSHP